MEAQSVEVITAIFTTLTISVTQHCVKKIRISKTPNGYMGSGIYFPRHLQESLRPFFYFWQYLTESRTSQVIRINRL
jgi:hypothetical protein